MERELQPIIEEAENDKKINIVKSSEKGRKDSLEGVKNMITLELNGLREEAAELGKKGEQENYVLNVLQPKIYALEKKIQELDGEKVIEKKSTGSESVTPMDKAKTQSLNEQQIKDLRESIMKAYVDSEQDATLKWLLMAENKQEIKSPKNRAISMEIKPKESRFQKAWSSMKSSWWK